MNISLQQYLRNTFPEYSNLTAMEIFNIQSSNIDFIKYISDKYVLPTISKELFFIDLNEFFERHKNTLSYDFINEHSFIFKYVLGVHFNFYEDINTFSKLTRILFEENNNEIFSHIIYNNETVTYNKSNFDYIILKYISFIKKMHLRSNIMFSFLYGYIIKNTDLTNFYQVSELSQKNTLFRIIESSMFYLEKNQNKYSIDLCYYKHCLYIFDQDSNLLLKKDLRLISKSSFFNDIIEPFKQIIANMDNQRKINFNEIWKEDFISYLQGLIDKRDMDTLRVEILKPKSQSIFINKIMYSQKPIIKISFEYNNVTIRSFDIYDYTSSYSLISYEYEYYKTIVEKNKLKKLITTEGTKSKKKRI